MIKVYEIKGESVLVCVTCGGYVTIENISWSWNENTDRSPSTAS